MRKIVLLTILLGFIPLYSKAQNFSISGGHRHSVMLCSSGKVYAFGKNNSGQLGASIGTAYSNIPLQVNGLPSIKMVDAGSGSHTLAVACDSTLWAWGLSSCGQLGSSTIASSCTTNSFSATPIRVERGMQPSVNGSPYLSKVISITVANEESYALLSTGEVMAWGKNNYGQLGIGTNINSSTPVYVMKSAGERLKDVVAIDAGDNQCYALLKDGTVWSWGNNDNYSLGRVANTLEKSGFAAQVMTQSSDLKNIVQIAAGNNHGLALDADGYLWSWGGNWAGQLGDAGSEFKSYASKVVNINVSTLNSIDFLSNVTSIAAGQSHSLAVLKDGRVVSFGSNNFYICPQFAGTEPAGQLGLGLTASGSCGEGVDVSRYPQVVLRAAGVPLENIVSVSEGDAWSFAISSTGQIFVWGWNKEGQLGIGNTVNQAYAVPFPDITNCSLFHPCPTANLGLDQKVCSVFSKTLKATTSVAYSSYNYSWYYSENKNGPYAALASSPTATQHTADKLGYYRVSISDSRASVGCGNCPVSSDTIQFSLLAPPFTPVASTYCGDSALFSVTGMGTFDWYDNLSAGTKLNTTPANFIKEKLINAKQINSTTHELYALNLSAGTGSAGPSSAPCAGAPYANPNTTMLFSAFKDFKLESIQLLQSPTPNGTLIYYEIELWSNNPIGIYCSNCCGGNSCYTDGPASVLKVSSGVSFPTTSVPTLRTIPLNFSISGSPVGTKYWLKIKDGTTVQNFTCAAPYPGFPYEDNSGFQALKILASTYIGSYMGYYGNMFNWTISITPTYTCGPVAVRVTEDCAPVCDKPSLSSITYDNSTTFCSNSIPNDITLSAGATPASPAHGTYEYKWLKNGAIINGLNSAELFLDSPQQSGNYTVRINISGKSCYQESSPVTVLIEEAPIANAGPDQSTSASTVFLNAESSLVATGEWSVVSGSAIINDKFDPNTSVTGLPDGITTLRWTLYSPTCEEVFDEVIIDKGSVPPVFVIQGPSSFSYEEEVTFSVPNESNVSYLWEVSTNGIIIAGQNTNSIIVKFSESTSAITLGADDDFVKLTKTNIYGNAAVSKELTLLSVTGIKNSSNIASSLNPNPFSQKATFMIRSGKKEPLILIISDLAGKDIIKSEYFTNEEILIGENLPGGIYFLKGIYGDQILLHKMIKID